MKCKEINNFLDDYVLNELDPDVEIQMNEHISECSKCNKELLQRETVMTTMKSSARFKPSVKSYKQIRKHIFIPQRQRKLLWIFPKNFIYATTAFLFGIVLMKTFDVLILKPRENHRVETKYETRYEEPFIDTVEFYHAPAKNLARI